MEPNSLTDEKIPVIAVVGPTASGKTALAVEIAGRYDGEIISADSMQIYREMAIATAKPSMEERKGIPHHLMDFLDPGESFSVARYAELAHEIIGQVSARGKLPILAGGTGLYVDSVLNDIRFAEMKSDPALREELTRIAAEKGPAALLEILREFDPESARTLHENNLGRVIRAIEVYRLTGVPMSEQQRRSRSVPSRYRALKIGINYRSRQMLYDRIDRRVDQMLEQGLLEETKRVISMNLATSAQAIGYKELAGYLDGKISLEEAVENLKRETRRYAKRQLTWFRRDGQVQWFYPDEADAKTIEKNIFICIDNFLKICYA